MNEAKIRIGVLLAAGLLAAVPASGVASEPPDPLDSQKATAMTPGRLVELLEGASTELDIQGNVASFAYADIPMACVWDAAADRMRILTPVAEEADLDENLRRILLEANFHAALDARYATSNGVVYSVFIHPLSSLAETELIGALRQVAALRRNYGSTFSSTDLLFGGGDGEEDGPDGGEPAPEPPGEDAAAARPDGTGFAFSLPARSIRAPGRAPAAAGPSAAPRR